MFFFGIFAATFLLTTKQITGVMILILANWIDDEFRAIAKNTR